MASQEIDNAEQGTVSEAGSPGSREEQEEATTSTYHATGRPPAHLMETQALGVTQILTGSLVLALGAVLAFLHYLSSLRHAFFFTFYTGYPLWGAAFFISSGSLSVAAARKPTKSMVQSAAGMNMSSATMAFVGVIFLSMNLKVNIMSLQRCSSSQSPDLCIYMGSSSSGLVFLMLILTLLELCITMYISITWCKQTYSNTSKETSSLPHSMEKGMPRGEKKMQP